MPTTSSTEVPECRQPQKRQIYVNATVDEPCFVCTRESLKFEIKYLELVEQHLDDFKSETSKYQVEFPGNFII